MINPSSLVQCSQDSTLTQVTSIMVNDNHDKNHKNNPYPCRTNISVTTIDEFHEQQQGNNLFTSESDKFQFYF